MTHRLLEENLLPRRFAETLVHSVWVSAPNEKEKCLSLASLTRSTTSTESWGRSALTLACTRLASSGRAIPSGGAEYTRDSSI